MLCLTNGWPLSKARVLIGRSIGKHWRAEFCTYAYVVVPVWTRASFAKYSHLHVYLHPLLPLRSSTFVLSPLLVALEPSS